MLWLIAICVALAFTASLLLVPAIRLAAHRFGIVDRPDSERKLQRRPVALGGGVAVYLALVATFGITILLDREFFGGLLGGVSLNWYLLFIAAAGILVVGLVDDAISLRGRQKLLAQCMIVTGLVFSGTIIHTVDVFGYALHLGVFAYPITVLWLILAVNALNLIDGADGMATTAGCIISIGLGFLSIQSASVLTGVVGFALAASLAGFLVFNKPPATIYLGDAGSMMIGLFVGVLAVWSNFKESTVLASAPIAILALPLFDSTAAVVRRVLTGRSIYATDRAHLHHLLQEKYGHGTMLMVVAVLCTLTTTLSVLSISFAQPWLAFMGIALVIGLLVFTRSFGHAEARLLIGRASHFAQSFATNPAPCDSDKQQHQVPLQGIGRWDTIWEPLVEFAKSQGLAKVKIDLNLAWIHEGYHANWQSIRLPEKAMQLSICVPLFAHRAGESVQIGRLEVIAPANDPEVYHQISDLSERLVDLGPEIDQIVSRLEEDKRQAHPPTSEVRDAPVQAGVEVANS
jgi:UDP-GlcNAc:undecaprenyl-phosphate GlcNAc-1-phosphate transferase